MTAPGTDRVEARGGALPEARCGGANAGVERARGALVLAGAALALFMVLAAEWTRRETDPFTHAPSPSHPDRWRLDPNGASAPELALLPGVGPGLAQRIVASRRSNGPFRTTDDLDRVSGIGPKTLEKIRPWIEIPPEAAAPGMAPDPA